MDNTLYLKPEIEEISLEEAMPILETSPGGSLENPGNGDDYSFGW